MDALTALLAGGLGGLIGYAIATGQPVPTEAQVLKSLEDRKPPLVKIVSIDTSEAHDKKEYHVAGQSIYVRNPTDPSKSVYIQLNEPESERIDLTDQRTIKAPFYQFFITNDAGTGTLELVVGIASVVELTEAMTNINIAAQSLGVLEVDIVAQSVGVLEIDVVAQTVGNLDINIAAQVADIDIKIASADIMTPVDIQAQYITVEVDVTKWGGTALTGANITTYLARLDITISALRDAIRGASTKDLSTLEADVEALLTAQEKHEYTTPANGGVNVTTSSTLVLAANSSRQYALIVNDSDEEIYLALGAAAVLHEGIPLLPKVGSYEITWLNLYTGAIYGIHGGSGDKVATVVEGD